MRVQPSAGGKPKRALGVQAVLEWAFRVEKAQLELTQRQDDEQESCGFGLEYVLMRCAVLGCKVGGAQHKSGSYTHPNAEVIGTERVYSRGKWRTIDNLICPVTWRPHPEPNASAQRGYQDWWEALAWVRDGLVAGGMLRGVAMTAVMSQVEPWVVQDLWLPSSQDSAAWQLRRPRQSDD